MDRCNGWIRCSRGFRHPNEIFATRLKLTRIIHESSIAAWKLSLRRSFQHFGARHTVKYASAPKCLQLRVSLRFSAPHHESSWIIRANFSKTTYFATKTKLPFPKQNFRFKKYQLVTRKIVSFNQRRALNPRRSASFWWRKFQLEKDLLVLETEALSGISPWQY